MQWHRRDATSRRLVTIPAIGPVTASAISASVPDASLFRSGRQFAAWLGLTPRANSSGGKDRLTGITKQGDGYLRRLLVVGATAVLRYARKGNSGRRWAMRLLERKRPKVVAVALANKAARIAWALLLRNEVYCRAGGLRATRSIALATEDRVGVLRGDDEPVVSGDRENPGGQGAKASAQF
jgi:transposase